MNDELDFTNTIMQDSLDPSKVYATLFSTKKYDSRPDDPNLSLSDEPIKHKWRCCRLCSLKRNNCMYFYFFK